MIQRPHGLPRWFEAGAALLGLVLLSPLFVAAGIAVAASSRGPLLFRQARVGRGGQIFLLCKFRTMRIGENGPSVTARGDARVTAVGRFLRKTKLDELPELWNVAKGEMALVGPRPEVPCYVQPGELWRQVLSVRPGVTDPVTLVLRNEEDLLAGVEGDPETFYRTVLQPYKLQHYVRYLRQRTAWTDLKVLAATLYTVVFPQAAPAPSQDDLMNWTRSQQGPPAPAPMKSARRTC